MDRRLRPALSNGHRSPCSRGKPKLAVPSCGVVDPPQRRALARSDPQLLSIPAAEHDVLTPDVELARVPRVERLRRFAEPGQNEHSLASRDLGRAGKPHPTTCPESTEKDVDGTRAQAVTLTPLLGRARQQIPGADRSAPQRVKLLQDVPTPLLRGHVEAQHG